MSITKDQLKKGVAYRVIRPEYYGYGEIVYLVDEECGDFPTFTTDKSLRGYETQRNLKLSDLELAEPENKSVKKRSHLGTDGSLLPFPKDLEWSINNGVKPIPVERDLPETRPTEEIVTERNDLLSRANKLSGIIKKRKNEVKDEVWKPKKTDIVWYVDSLNDVQSNKSDYLVDRVQRFRTESEAKSEAMRRESMKRGRMPKLGEVVYSWFMNCDRPDDFKFKWENEAEQIEEYYLGRTFKTKEECLEHCKKYSKFWGEI